MPKILNMRGVWVAQSVKCPTLAQVTISQFVSSRPALGSLLSSRSLEPTSDSVFLSLSRPHSCSVSQKWVNDKHFFLNKKTKFWIWTKYNFIYLISSIKIIKFCNDYTFYGRKYVLRFILEQWFIFSYEKDFMISYLEFSLRKL